MSAKKPTRRRPYDRRIRAVLKLLREALPVLPTPGLSLRIVELKPFRGRLFVTVQARRAPDKAKRFMVHPVTWRDMRIASAAALYGFRRAAERLGTEWGLAQRPLKVQFLGPAPASCAPTEGLHIGQQFTLEGLDRRTGELTLRLV